MIKQISVFLENKSGRLVRVAQVLGDAAISIRGVSIADTSDFGILRMIVDQPDRAIAELKGKGIMATVTDVIAIEIADQPGGLAQVLTYLDAAAINIEYLYSFIEKPTHSAIIMMRVERIADALQVLQDHNVPIVSGERIYGF